MVIEAWYSPTEDPPVGKYFHFYPQEGDTIVHTNALLNCFSLQSINRAYVHCVFMLDSILLLFSVALMKKCFCCKKKSQQSCCFCEAHVQPWNCAFLWLHKHLHILILKHNWTSFSVFLAWESAVGFGENTRRLPKPSDGTFLYFTPFCVPPFGTG